MVSMLGVAIMTLGRCLVFGYLVPKGILCSHTLTIATVADTRTKANMKLAIAW